MKVILSGSTGFIGGEVLNQALVHPKITSLVCITRKPLPEAVESNPKVKVIILKDFTSYPPDILSQLGGAECCIWALGSPAHKNPNLEDCRKTEIRYTHAAAEVFAKSITPSLKGEGKSFRFVYLSGKMAERDTDKKLWFLHDTRTIKGEVENGLLAIQEKEPSFEVSIMRPGGVLAKDTLVPNILVGVTMSIKVDELAAAMISEDVESPKGTRTFENDVLRKKGIEVLRGR
ncbi:related to nucleoside-diphosphate-sugar epimerase [Phialocephala subalpina]|uniref:Related to nucleoside-diphosphate-sugar epimerase n=1 Tax=Phialocephala subalpina TaxID=576137 RepID=A0A1L7WR13_9HELO|nr:related to nucleoside-diphosphate-sugar epimerase [Phialocephala subalpina]